MGYVPLNSKHLDGPHMGRHYMEAFIHGRNGGMEEDSRGGGGGRKGVYKDAGRKLQNDRECEGERVGRGRGWASNVGFINAGKWGGGKES